MNKKEILTEWEIHTRRFVWCSSRLWETDLENCLKCEYNRGQKENKIICSYPYPDTPEFWKTHLGGKSNDIRTN